MFFATAVPAQVRRPTLSSSNRSFERFLLETALTSRQSPCTITQDDKSYTLVFDVPGVTKEQLTIGLEGNIVRIETREEAPRQYKFAYELPQDIDSGQSEAKLENGVLSLNLGKQLPLSRVTKLPIS